MLMTRIGAPFALVDGSLCHLYTLNLAQVYLAASLRELTEAFVLAISLTKVSAANEHSECNAREDNVKDLAPSTQARGRWRFPRHARLGLHRHPRVGRTLSAKAGSDRAACLCLQPTGRARNPRTSRAVRRGAASGEHPSSLETTVARTPAGSEVGPMRCCLKIAFDRCLAPLVQRCNRRPIRRAHRPS